MHKTTQVALLERVLDMIESQSLGAAAPQTLIDALRYCARERHEQERALFLRSPLVIGRESDAPQPGSFFTVDVAGAPILLARDQQGQLRAFYNVCRHRGTVLCTEESGQRKAFVCRYHGWAYELSGKLMNVPLRSTFPTLRDEDHGLHELPLQLRHGFVIVVPTPSAAPPSLEFGTLDDDLTGFALAQHVTYKRVTVERACNWKLVIDAFLEGYHVKSLHRTSIAKFFRDDGVVVDYFGPHVRSIGARRDLVESLRGKQKDEWNIRDVATVYYFLFPNTVLVFHPDWLSHITMYPLQEDRCRCVHTMLTPRQPDSDALRQHYDRSFELINGQVFEKEDLAIAESVQRGMSALPLARYPLGVLEHPISHFHHHLDEKLAQP